jgi:hypothetical protein
MWEMIILKKEHAIIIRWVSRGKKKKKTFIGSTEPTASSSLKDHKWSSTPTKIPFGNVLTFVCFQKRMKWAFNYKYWMFQNTCFPPFICVRTTSFQKQYFTIFLRVSSLCTVHLFFFFLQFVNFFNNF